MDLGIVVGGFNVGEFKTSRWDIKGRGWLGKACNGCMRFSDVDIRDKMGPTHMSWWGPQEKTYGDT